MPGYNDMFKGFAVTSDDLGMMQKSVEGEVKPEKRMVMEIVGEGDFPELEEEDE